MSAYSAKKLKNTQIPEYKQAAETQSTSQNIINTYMYLPAPLVHTLGIVEAWIAGAWVISCGITSFTHPTTKVTKCKLTLWESYSLE